MTDPTLLALETRRSCRNFKPDMPAEEEIGAVLRAGTFAPTGMGKQSPLIIAVTNRELRDRIVEENRKIGGWQPGFDPFYGAPVILIVLADRSINAGTYLYDGSCVMANLLNAAAAVGLGSCWIHRAKEEFESPFGKELLARLGISGDLEGIGHVALGYAAQEPEAGEYCYYRPFISAAISPDPSAQAETLGNDLRASSAAGIRNCRALLSLDGMDEHRREFVSKQYYRYLWLCLSNIGGAVNGVPVRENEQTRTLRFVLENLSTTPEQLYDDLQEKRILDELNGNFLPVRIKETLGDKALKRYNCRLKRQLKKYGY